MGQNPRRGYANAHGVRVLTTLWGHWYWDETAKTVAYIPAHMQHPAIRLPLTLNNANEAVRRACSQAVTWKGELKPILTKEEE